MQVALLKVIGTGNIFTEYNIKVARNRYRALYQWNVTYKLFEAIYCEEKAEYLKIISCFFLYISLHIS